MSDSGVVPSESLDDALLKARIKSRMLGLEPKVCLGRFELLARLGRGGEGTVYEARDRNDGSLVALKQLHPSHVAFGASLTREFRALADLVHPNLVVLHELFHEEGAWFFTMELIVGSDFVQYAAGGEEPLRSALDQLLAGLEALHGAGKMHRDLKPSNVLVREDGSVVILDYGLVIEQGEATGDRAGTPAYAAPEQIDGHVEPASDLYSVGVMLFHALTGRPPFSGTTAQMRAQKVEGPQRPATIIGSVPSDLDELCMQLLAPMPSDRPTAAEARARCAGRNLASIDVRSVRSASECFVGRHELLDELTRLASERVPVFVLLDGQSGIGKTALLQRFCATRVSAGALVLDGRCYERENLPYKALDAIVEQLVSYLNGLSNPATLALPREQLVALLRLFPAFRRLRGLPGAVREDALATDDADLRSLAFSAVRSLFAAIAAAREVVFAVDDLQWGDLDSIDLLEHLFEPNDPPPILLLGVYRSEERDTSPAMQVIARREMLSGEHLLRVERTVGPLARDDAAALLRALADTHGALSPDQMAACLTQASGMPFALHQLVEHVHDVERASTSPDGALRELVRLRAARCSASARALLEVLCVAGRPLEVAVALRCAASASVSWSAAAELCARKLARWRDAEHGRCLEPYHDLVRSALTLTTPPERARAVHRDIVSALEALACDQPEHLVEHLLLAGEPERAGELALIAADRAALQLAWNRTAELLALAKRTLPVLHKERANIPERLAGALASADRYRAAADAYLDAAKQVDSSFARQRLESLAARHLMRAGDNDAGIALLERLLFEVGYRYPRGGVNAEFSFMFNRIRQRFVTHFFPRGPAPTPERSSESQGRMQVLAAAHSELWVSDPVRGSLIHTWFFREARRCADHRWLRALAWETVHLAVRYGAKGAARVERLLAETDAMAIDQETAFDRAMRYLARAVYLLFCCWRPREGGRWLMRADEQFRLHCPGSSFERHWTALMADLASEMTGDFNSVLLAIAQRLREGPTADGSQHFVLSVPLARMIEDRPDEAFSFLEELWKPAKRVTLLDYGVLMRKCSVLLYRGETERSYRELCRMWWPMQQSGLFSTQVAQNAAYHRARGAVALYWEQPSRGLRRQVVRYTTDAPRCPPVMRGLFNLLLASLARADGDDGKARERLIAARDDCAGDGADAGANCARYRLAQLDRDADLLAQVDAWFRSRGVRNPERWVALSAPGAPGWSKT